MNKEDFEALKIGRKILKDAKVADKEFKGQAEFTGGADKASCPIAELLKDKEAVKELADIFADSVVNKFAKRVEPRSNAGVFRDSGIKVEAFKTDASSPLVELLKDKEAMKELAFIFADAYFDTSHERANNCGLKRK